MMDHILSATNKSFILLFDFPAFHQFPRQKPLRPFIHDYSKPIQSKENKSHYEKDILNCLNHFSEHRSIIYFLIQFNLTRSHKNYLNHSSKQIIIDQIFYPFTIDKTALDFIRFYNKIQMAKRTSNPRASKSSKIASSKMNKSVKISKLDKAPAKNGSKAKVAKKHTAKITKKTASKRTSRVKTTKIPRAPKNNGSSSSVKGYTSSQYERFLTEKQNLKGCSIPELKDTLRKNLQSMSGNKDELIEKVADGIVLGRISRCPKCFGGRPKFDFKKGTYHCSGYRDDEDFKNCHQTFELGEIKRDRWE